MFMKKILILNGPNINMLGLREPDIYGKNTYLDLCDFLENNAKALKIDIEIFQSNHEGELVDKIQSAYDEFDGIIINAAAYTHTSIAILDALKATDIETVEVHMSNILEREEFRKTSYISLFSKKVFMGKGFESYLEALKYFAS